MIGDSREYSGATFEQLDLAGRDLGGIVFEDCVFKSCNLAGANLGRDHFSGCVFDVCDLSNAKLLASRIQETSFKQSKLLGVQWVTTADLRNPSFVECNLSLGNFSGMRLRKTTFLKCRAHEVEFSAADLAESDFSGCDLREARFNQTVLLKADFRGAINYAINPVENKVKGARFSLPEALGLLVGLGVTVDDEPKT